MLGESKTSRLGTEDPARLDRIAELLDGRESVSVAPAARRLLFSAQGFSPDLATAARRRADVELIDIDRPYEGA